MHLAWRAGAAARRRAGRRAAAAGARGKPEFLQGPL
jgi:hypothetical protein